MVLKGGCYLYFCEGSWKESQIQHFWLGSWKNVMSGLCWTRICFSASHVVLCHQHSWCCSVGCCWSWFLWLQWSLQCFYTKLGLNLTWYLPGVLWWSLYVFLFLPCRNSDLGRTFLFSAEVTGWSAYCHHNNVDLSWILWGILLAGSCLHPVHGETLT